MRADNVNYRLEASGQWPCYTQKHFNQAKTIPGGLAQCSLANWHNRIDPF